MISVALHISSPMGDRTEEFPLLGSFHSANEPEEPPLKRTGTVWTATAHVITGVIGAGVLSLAWSMAQLGWIAGPLCMILFAAITIVSTYLLCECYRFPDPEHGPIRNRSYMEAVGFYLGEKSQIVRGIFAEESLYGCGIAYTITSAGSIRKAISSLWVKLMESFKSTNLIRVGMSRNDKKYFFLHDVL